MLYIRQTGIPGCIFVHASGFIGGHKTEEGATMMALKVWNELTL